MEQSLENGIFNYKHMSSLQNKSEINNIGK